MPALIHNSPAFSSAGIALLSQGAEEQPTGLVRVNVVYSLTQARAQNIEGIFFHDARPPVAPTLYSSGSLDGGLFLESYSVKKAYGQFQVSASYAGARRVSKSFRGFITRSSEARVTPPFKDASGFFTASVRFVAQVVKTSIASANQPFFDIEGTSSNPADIESRISRLQYGVISFAGRDLSAAESQILINFNAIASPRAIFNSFNPVIQTSTSVDNVTNSIIVATTTRDIVFLQGGSN
jgi:hypothetical protein